MEKYIYLVQNPHPAYNQSAVEMFEDNASLHIHLATPSLDQYEN